MKKLIHRLGWRLVGMGFRLMRASGHKATWRFKDWSDMPPTVRLAYAYSPTQICAGLTDKLLRK